MIGLLSPGFLAAAASRIRITETVNQQGVADDPGDQASVEITASGENDTTTDTAGNSVTLDGTGTFLSNSPGAGWSVIGNGNPSTFQKDDAGAVSVSLASGGGSVNQTNAGGDPAAGSPEIHTITPSAAPTGGTWKAHSSGTAIDHDADATAIEGSLAGTAWETATVTSGTTLAAGPIQLTNGANGDVGNLSPVNVDLTA